MQMWSSFELPILWPIIGSFSIRLFMGYFTDGNGTDGT